MDSEDKDKQLSDAEHHSVKLDPWLNTRYSWVICACCATMNFCIWGLNSGFAVYFQHFLHDDTFPGATKLDYSFIGGISYGAMLAFTPLTNWIWVRLGKYGLTTIISVGTVCQFAALMLASWSTKIWQLYLTQGLLLNVGLSLISMASLTLPSMYFSKDRRGLPSSISAGTSGLGGVLFNLMCGRIVEINSVGWALRAQAFIILALMLFPICVARDRPEMRVFPKANFGIYKSIPFYWLSLYTITSTFGYLVLLYTLGSFVTSLGYSQDQGFLVSALVNLGSVVGRILIGYLSDFPKTGVLSTTIIAHSICCVLCLAMWIPARNYATCVAFALLVGAVMGSIFGMLAPSCARIWGDEVMRYSFSNQWALLGISAVFSPPIGTSLTKFSGGEVNPKSFQDCSIWVGVCYFVSVTMLLLIRGYVKARDGLILNNPNNPQPHIPMKMVFTHMFTLRYDRV
ncbi:hypothetical protein DIURU_004328 [Diutina rugosa]|uniref:Major facilitator superfamily (MFS) profile domain-containing protein n=1 Tax=Diutina rugosa TaxID=5481 RepID=A0A642UHT7_DIURU|nr:uncharacterized protein DIURU_004328 [Diutina rugosa]KAA8899306.1 hypothetical protein DIURU_004328 [Diutina rugosa]